MQTVRIGTRGSKLALYQAYRVKEELETQFKEIAFEIEIIKTKGDKILDVPLSKIGDKGLFTKELEIALFNKEIDMAVHSLKDLPTTFPQGAKLGAVLKRGDVRDALISLDNRKLNDLKSDDVIATSSLRRKAQLLRMNKDFKIVEIRGNVNTRIRKMEEGYCNVMVMAAAGLQRLEMGGYISELIDTDIMIPACSQGAIAIEIRENDAFIESILSKINDTETLITTSAERAFLKTLEGGCQIPVGSFSFIKDGQFYITGFISDIDGQRYLKESGVAPVEDAVEISINIAKKLYSLGGKEILESIRLKNEPVNEDSLPLQGKVIISTRAIDVDDMLPDLLQAKGATVISLPMLEILATQLDAKDIEVIKNTEKYDWIFFTSKNGVVNFFKHLIDVKGTSELGKQVKIAVIGSKTAAELDYYGYSADFVSEGNTSEEMLIRFNKEYNPKGLKIMLALGNLADDKLLRSLGNDNEVKRINVYQTLKPKDADSAIIETIVQDNYDLVVFTSPSTFQNLCTFMDAATIRHFKMASIGSTTTKAIEDCGLSPLLTAKKSSVEGLYDAILEYFKK